MTVFGLLAGGVAGAVAAAFSWAFGSTGALIFTALLSIGGGWLCLRIPAWVESTAGEVPVDGVGPKAKRAFPLSVTTTLWANGTIRVETGFLALFIAFVIKSEYTESSGFTQLLLLGVVGLAAGLGGFIGNGLGSRLPLTKPETVSILSLAATAVSTLVAVLIPGLATAAIVGLVGSTASSLAKVCLDSVIQHELPEASRASAFGLSETVLQLSWVFGGVVGLLIGGVWSFGHDSVYAIGFAVITVVLVVGLIQSWLVRSGSVAVPVARLLEVDQALPPRPAKTGRQDQPIPPERAATRDAGAAPTPDGPPAHRGPRRRPGQPGPSSADQPARTQAWSGRSIRASTSSRRPQPPSAANRATRRRRTSHAACHRRPGRLPAAVPASPSAPPAGQPGQPGRPARSRRAARDAGSPAGADAARPRRGSKRP